MSDTRILTLGELRAALAHLPDDTRVVVDGYEDDYSDARLGWVRAHLGVDTGYGGEHLRHRSGMMPACRTPWTKCVLIGGRDSASEGIGALTPPAPAPGTSPADPQG